MRRKWMLDWCVVCIALAGGLLSWFYLEENYRIWSTAAFFAILLVFFFMALSDKEPAQEIDMVPAGSGITELVLLSEENTELAKWDLYGKTSLLIGRDTGENQVDVNLGHVTYASMINIEHTVLNYAAGNWYVEDLGSRNGVSVQAAADGKKYKLAADKPCRLRRGDILFVGLTRLVIR